MRSTTMMLCHIEMMRLTVDGMMARGFGRIVNIVSRSVKIPQLELAFPRRPRRPSSDSPPASPARPWRTTSPSITCCRGYSTAMPNANTSRRWSRRGKTFDELWRARAAGNLPKRFGKPEELGDYCAFLCSHNAGFITGQNLVIDGGSYPARIKVSGTASHFPPRLREGRWGLFCKRIACDPTHPGPPRRRGGRSKVTFMTRLLAVLLALGLAGPAAAQTYRPAGR